MCKTHILITLCNHCSWYRMYSSNWPSQKIYLGEAFNVLQNCVTVILLFKVSKVIVLFVRLQGHIWLISEACHVLPSARYSYLLLGNICKNSKVVMFIIEQKQHFEHTLQPFFMILREYWFGFLHDIFKWGKCYDLTESA